jgi:hypothetical protein
VQTTLDHHEHSAGAAPGPETVGESPDVEYGRCIAPHQDRHDVGPLQPSIPTGMAGDHPPEVGEHVPATFRRGGDAVQQLVDR